MKTVTVRKGGKIVRVSPNELDKYVSKGYVIVEDKKVSEVQETVPHEPEFIEEAKPVVEDTVETVKPRGKRKRND